MANYCVIGWNCRILIFFKFSSKSWNDKLSRVVNLDLAIYWSETFCHKNNELECLLFSVIFIFFSKTLKSNAFRRSFYLIKSIVMPVSNLCQLSVNKVSWQYNTYWQDLIALVFRIISTLRVTISNLRHLYHKPSSFFDTNPDKYRIVTRSLSRWKSVGPIGSVQSI